MVPKIANISVPIEGMTCVGCETRLENALRKTRGIESVKASYANSRALITYDANMIDEAGIAGIIESLDYQVKKPELPRAQSKRTAKPVPATRAGHSQATANPAQQNQVPKTSINRILGVGIILAALFVIIKQLGGFDFFNAFPQAEQGMGYGLLFVIGLLTSIHCVAMCGGINLSQCVPQQTAPISGAGRLASLRPSLLYNGGRVISYTIIGGAVGALGSVISLSGWAKGLVAIVAGVFMVVMGLNMLNIFPGLRRFNPHMPKIFAQKINAEKLNGSRSPFYVGLLNGLMPCGPLQAMQLFALSTGSPIKGALAMLLFSLGTVPLMFGLGALSSLISKKFTQKMMQVSAILVIILGIVMFQNGLGLSGLALPSLSSLGNRADGAAQVAAQTEGSVTGEVQYLTTQLSSRTYEPITVKAGIPVKWTIHAAAGTVNGCNNRLIIPAYKIEKQLKVGDNLIEFTPTKTGTIPYSCWMGMIRSQIKVVANTAAAPTAATAATTVRTAREITGTTTTNNNQLTAAESQSLPAAGLAAGGCCGIGTASLSSSNPEKIKLAELVDGKQQATITVDGYGYSPQILVVQKGLATDLRFDVRQATACSGKVYIPEFGINLDLAKDGAIPTFIADTDFTVSCWMNMIGMNVIVVDDLENVDPADIQAGIALAPQQITGGGCCG